MNATYFFTGYPGFLATNIVKTLADRNSHAQQFHLLVHPSQLDKAAKEAARLPGSGGHQSERFRLLPGDITQKNMGLDGSSLFRLNRTVTHAFHLAAVYDLAVPMALAYKVNVAGTANVNDWVLSLSNLKRYVYFSTAYISGKRRGKVLETELQTGQTYKNHYESTKYEAEVLVQSIRGQVPATILRPGVVMGWATP